MALEKPKSYRSFGSIRQLSKNKFQASYKWKGKTHYGPHVFFFKTDANEWLALQQAALLSGNEPATHQTSTPGQTESDDIISFSLRHIEVQVNSKGRPLAASTKKKYRSYVERHFRDLGPRLVEDITPSVVNDWYARLLETGHTSSASKAYKLLNCVMNRAIAEDRIEANPCKIRGAQNASTGAPIYTPSRNEVLALLETIDQRYECLALLSVVAALRFGEATALRVSDIKSIDFDGKVSYFLDISKSVTRINGSFVEGPTKSSAGVRMTPLSSDTVARLHEHINTFCDLTDPNSLLFPSACGTYMHNGVFAKTMKTAQKKAGLPSKGFGPHALRRAGATFLSEGGAHVDEVKTFLGDSTHKAALCYVKTTTRMPGLIENMSNQLTDTP